VLSSTQLRRGSYLRQVDQLAIPIQKDRFAVSVNSNAYLPLRLPGVQTLANLEAAPVSHAGRDAQQSWGGWMLSLDRRGQEGY
jgi:hypothetical protein